MFIGADSVILPNVTINNNTIVAAGSMVNKDVPEGKIVGGVPAKIIGNTAELADRRKEYSKITKNINKLEFLWEEYEREN